MSASPTSAEIAPATGDIQGVRRDTFRSEVRRWQRLVGESPAIRGLESSIDRVASFDCPVLITGETGCGKEEVARAIHHAGARREQPFVAVNCGSLVSTIAESQLFGHVKGSFTGAFGSSLGVFRAAHGGVVFLDEIGELSLDLQPKLLQVLQRLEVTPVGSTEPQTVDVQVIAATNRDLEADVDAGLFREDLFYRLNTIHLLVPPLRSRQEDIPLFLEYFSAHFAKKYDRQPWQPEAATLERLVRYPWPGNVRQLIQVVQRIYVFHDRVETVLAELLDGPAAAGAAEPPQSPGSDAIEATRVGAVPMAVDLPAVQPAVSSGLPALLPPAPPQADHSEMDLSTPATVDPLLPVVNLDELRRLAVRQALAAVDGHRGRAAEMLGVSLNTMTRLVAEACPGLVAKSGRKPSAKPRHPR